MLKTGSVVRSTAGRDKGTLYAVLRCSGKTVTVADGKLHPLERPKSKNIRHIAITAAQVSAEEMAVNCGLKRTLSRCAEQSDL